MRKLLITILIALLLILAAFIGLKGFTIGNIEILSYMGIRQRNAELDSTIQQASKLAETDYRKAVSDVVENSRKLMEQKETYEEMAMASSEGDVQASSHIERYELETLWVKLGSYATSEGVVLKMDVKNSASGDIDYYDLEFTVHGSYISITDFISDIENDDTLESISKKIKDKVNSVRNKKIKKEGANNIVDLLGKLPNILRVPIVGILKWCDKKMILPRSMIKDNLYYSSIILSNLGSIKCGAIYHNIADFGTCSSLATMGEIKLEELIINGKKQKRNLCEFGINIDERIADGYYFAKSIKILQFIFENPELLEEKASKKIDMDEIR